MIYGEILIDYEKDCAKPRYPPLDNENLSCEISYTPFQQFSCKIFAYDDKLRCYILVKNRALSLTGVQRKSNTVNLINTIKFNIYIYSP